MNTKAVMIAALAGLVAVVGYGSHAGLSMLRAFASAAQAAAVAPRQDSVAGTLPDGASTLTETYQAWQVVCQPGPKGETCVVSQRVADSKTHKRIMAIQFHPDGKAVAGIVALPLGVRLTDGVAIRVDGKAVGKSFAFTTCIPEGCIASLTLDESQLALLESAKKAEFSFFTAAGHHVDLPITVTGLDHAITRVRALSR
ncbi:invasion associated locus B family protein [Acetobacter sp. TBRC 12305]|uniref:Invasion associated locus B family protein n=1 Tax=Acetobacter garciniae TaxID=2817435 RepID=A0A939HKE4_9PROT|nr:invasion associated locus B family protein [Acetobacter garciniae]MBO1325097.1 invasion associated locus B family protein [Acetobacter garciniae]MBX0344932.1 invasion associated locus B family protein [Acetobacter garciniae]